MPEQIPQSPPTPDPDLIHSQAQFAASGTALPGDPGRGDLCRFEIIAITAGNGNGWQFSEKVLEDSLSLWEGAEVFIDHSWFGPRSIRDLAGVCSSPVFDADKKAIKLTLKASGPSGPLLEAIGRDLLSAADPKPRIGFSADVFFTSRQNQVQQILRVKSLDLVHNPARGGAFIRALNQQLSAPDAIGPQELLTENWKLKTGDSKMGEENKEVKSTVEAMRSLLGVQQEQQALAEEANKAREMRLQMCGYLLESGLSAAKLPPALVSHVRLQFKDKIFEPAELTAAIDSARSLLGELQAGSVISGPRIGSMLSGEDRLQAAVDDLLGAPREKDMEGKQVEKLTGIRELYTMLTGDVDLHGGYNSSRVQLSTTATMPGLVKNALNKMLVSHWEELGRAGYRWWEPIVSVEHFNNLNDITGVLVGEVNILPSIAEGGAYTELLINDSPEVGTWSKYGGYLPLTLELIDRDDLTRLKAYPRKLASSSLRRISSLIASVFTANGGTGPIMADGTALFTAAHGNLGAVALASAEWEVASSAIYNQPMLVGAGVAPILAVDAKYLLVPRELRLTGMRILYPSWERESNIVSENMQKGSYGDVITVPDFTDGTDWAAVADPRIAPAIILAERFGLKPEIFIAGDELSPAMFANDEVRLKIRHFLSVLVADHRPLYKENVAGG